MIAEKYAILYVTSATVCECVLQRKVLQDNTEYCSSDSRSSPPLGFEIDLSNHHLFLFEVLILICVCSVSLSFSLSPTPHPLLFPVKTVFT